MPANITSRKFCSSQQFEMGHSKGTQGLHRKEYEVDEG